nr:immunoglobulin heavy chain junction region [Mus musculus]
CASFGSGYWYFDVW